MKIATMGTGVVVETFLQAALEVRGVECVAVHSRLYETGKKLADKFGVTRVDTDVDEMLSNPVADFVYIALPNSLHYAYAKKALLCGKNVICEKPFTSTLQEMEHLTALAREKNLFLFEGISTIYLPNFLLLQEHLKDIGKIRLIQCSYCQYSRKYDQFMSGAIPNVFNPEFSGGALMDLNIYNLHFVMKTLGLPEKKYYHPLLHENGIDLGGFLVLRYPGVLCECVAAKNVHGSNGAQIHGEKGYIHIPGSVSACKSFTVFSEEGEHTYDVQRKDNKLYYEIAAFQEMFAAGNLAACHRLLDYSRDVMETLYEARLGGGVTFAADRQ